MILVQLYSLAYIEGKIKGEIAIYICGNVGTAGEVMHFRKVQERVSAFAGNLRDPNSRVS